MRAFEVYLNGRKLCTAGIAEAGVVTSAITWVAGADPKQSEDMELRVGGLISRTHTHVDWMHRRLIEGDEVRIVVTERAEASKPKKETRASATQRRKWRLDHLKRLAEKLGYELKKKRA